MRTRQSVRRKRRPVLRNTQVFIAISGRREYTITNGRLNKYFNVYVDEEYVKPDEIGVKGNTIIFLFNPPFTDSEIKVNY